MQLSLTFISLQQTLNQNRILAHPQHGKTPRAVLGDDQFSWASYCQKVSEEKAYIRICQNTSKASMIVMSQNENEIHKKTAAKCFNEAWDYLDKKNRTADDEQKMLHLAHAACYHRSFVGTPLNFAIGDWQVSRVYAAINEPSLALRFAKSALEITQKNNFSGNLPSAYEGMARAYIIAKQNSSAKDYVKRARDALKAAKIGAEDKKIYSDQIDETEALLKQ
jgi:hypothetical protein